VLAISLLPAFSIQDQVNKGKSLGLDCAAINDVKDLSNVASGKTQLANNLTH